MMSIPPPYLFYKEMQDQQEDRSEYFKRLLKTKTVEQFEDQLKEIAHHSDSFIENCNIGKNAKIMLERTYIMWQTYQEEPSLTIVCKNKKGIDDLNAYLNWVDRRNINQGIGLLLITPDTLTDTNKQFVWYKEQMSDVRGIENCNNVYNRNNRKKQ